MPETLRADTNPLLILDLDETLIFATSSVDHRGCDFVIGPYRVFVRPGLPEFLESVSQFYRVAIWTSSGKDYASEIVGRILPAPIELEFLWTRDRCTQRAHPDSGEITWLKDLKKVKRRGYALDQIVVVDNTPSKLARHYGNLVAVRSFRGEKKDSELDSLSRYLVHIRSSSSFRAISKRNWRTVVSSVT